MEFLILGRVASGGEWPGEEHVDLMIQGLQQFQQDPRTKAIYGFAGENAGCILCDCNSAEELDQYLTLNAVSQFAEWEVHALTPVNAVINTMQMLSKHLKAA